MTVWESVIQRFPGLNTLYLGDNARYPYGNKGVETISRYASEAVFYLAGQRAELVVVACGTASSVAVRRLQSVFRVPVIGIVEGFSAQAAELCPQGKSVAVLGTRFTVASGRFEEELKAHGVTKVWSRACPLFVPLVEEGVSPGAMARAASEMYLADVPDDVAVMMLACTHFPRLAHSIAEIVHERLGRTVIYRSAEGDRVLMLARGACAPREVHSPAFNAPLLECEDAVYLLDSSAAILHAVRGFLDAQEGGAARFFGSGQRILCTDAPERFAQVARVFVRGELPQVSQVHLAP